MRHLIVLPGNSLKNKAWGELVVEHYAPIYNSSFLLTYDHWVNGESNINFVTEAKKLQSHVDSLAQGTEITLFAKSAGSLLGLIVMHNKVVEPMRAVFFGMPLDLAADSLFKDSWSAVSELKVPAIAFHNVADPTTSYEFTRTTLAEHNPNITLVTTEESEHWYGDTQTYNRTIISFLLFNR